MGTAQMGCATQLPLCPSKDDFGFVLAVHNHRSSPSQSPDLEACPAEDTEEGDIKDTGSSCAKLPWLWVHLGVDAVGMGLGAGLHWELMSSH